LNAVFFRSLVRNGFSPKEKPFPLSLKHPMESGELFL
jgi:hypothetical protein